MDRSWENAGNDLFIGLFETVPFNQVFFVFFIELIVEVRT